MEEQSETLSSKKEFAFASSTILSQVGRGIIVGLIVGIINFTNLRHQGRC